ncbi:hypothetical protein [Pseudoxanthomonas sp. UTMC 1351]|uniref:hypothetical protein n=1 Tax=Pseudoxanthomonas sp. UTMC 1351 TaxID=2695853 RepID=UPI0034CEE39F
MDNYITVSELIGLLTVLWLPIFGVAAVLHWQLLPGRRWRVAWVSGSFFLGVALAFAIWISPIHRLFVYLGQLSNFFAVGGIPIQAALLSALIMTLLLLALRRAGLPPNNSFKPNPLRGSA